MVRRDVYEVIELEENQKIKLNVWGIKGYTVIEEEKIETIEIGGIKYSKKEVEEKLKDLKVIK